MIFGVGCDVVDLRRFGAVLRRYPRRFPERILAADEDAGGAQNGEVQFLAGRWAAKEALGKALGRGVKAPFSLRQVGVGRDKAGRPFFVFSAAAKRELQKMRVCRCHLGISHDGNYALATVVAETSPPTAAAETSENLEISPPTAVAENSESEK